MKKALILFLFALSLYAIDWSDRSTQELIAALGYEKSENIPVILNELKKREMTMTPKEKKAYLEKLEQLKKK
jgi:hypothetical protein